MNNLTHFIEGEEIFTYEHLEHFLSVFSKNVLTEIENLTKTDKALHPFIRRAVLNELESRAAKLAEELACFCRKCGQEIKCMHGKNEAHVNALCGNCAS